MTQAQRQQNRRREAAESSERAARERRQLKELRDIRRSAARQCGLDLRSVALGPQFDSSGYFCGASELELVQPRSDGHKRRIITNTNFDPRAYEVNTVVDYYTLPTA